MREHRHRTRSPPRRKYGDRETEENRSLYSNRRPNEPHRSRRVGSGSRHYDNDDDDKDVYKRKLSQFNEALPRGELTSRKFEWANLLADKPQKSDSGGILADSDNFVGLNKSERPHYSLCPSTADYKNAPVLPSVMHHLGANDNTSFISKDHLVLRTRTTFQSTVQLNEDYSARYKNCGVCRSRELLAESVGSEGYFGQISVSNPSAMPPYLSSMLDGEQRSQSYCFNRTTESVGHDYRAENSVRGSIVDSIVDKLDGTRNSESWTTEPNHDSHDQLLHIRKESVIMEQEGEHSGSRISNVSKGSELMELDGEYSGSGSRNFQVECGLEASLDNGSSQVREDFGFRRDGGLESYKEGVKRLNQDVLYENEDRSQRMLVEEELGIKDQSGKVLNGARVVDLRMITQNPKHDLPSDWINSNENYHLASVDEQWTSEDIDRFPALNTLEFRQPLDEMTSDDLLSSPFLPVSIQEHSSEHVKGSSGDIKNRLGPARNVMERLGPAQNTKKRTMHPSKHFRKKYLKPARNGFISLPCFRSHDQNNYIGRNTYEFPEGAYVQRDGYLEVEMKSSKTEPLEHTEHFKQLVNSAFMKFFKALNENTAQRRKFTEREGKCTLKCSVCCRNSKEFADTRSLVQHAFMSMRVGLRAEHLGFHRAICVLMGWNYAASHNGLWVPRVLPYTEALALKQDLIIWPPVVFVNNSSIAKTNLDEQIIVSIGELDSIIRGMGFGRGITKICRGRAANQGSMVVNFHGTFSGLQEAERLHNLYAENKCGRAEFEQITFQSSNRGDKTHNANKIESVLYGYLGIAEDLDKLDFEAKRRCFVKSKKEILAIADKYFDGEMK